MQLVGRVLPINSYLHRIKKHPTGECRWCKGKRETITHFMSECKHFQKSRTAAHHLIVRAVVSALREAKPVGWRFFYETPFSQMPFEYAWTDDRERRKQAQRRPDCIAYHAGSKQVLLMEFTRAMDHEHTMPRALDTKTHQYDAAVRAIRRGDSSVHVRTVPVVFGVRGSILYNEAVSEFRSFGLKETVVAKVLAAGVRAAVTAASDMITARFAALGGKDGQ